MARLPAAQERAGANMLTRAVDSTLLARLKSDADFARQLLVEAVEILFAGDVAAGTHLISLLLRGIGSAEALRTTTELQAERIEALMAGSEPGTAEELFAVITALQSVAGIHLSVHAAA